MSVNGFLARKNVGLILRVFAAQAEQVADRVKMVEEITNCALLVKVAGQAIISRVDVLVWADQKFGNQSDCGLTTAALREKFPRKKGSKIFVSKVNHGDLFCGLLNYGIALQSRAGVDYSIIASAEARSYMTPQTMEAMVIAADNGALAIGVAIKELTDSILAGRIANTFAMWHNVSLLTVGGFDLRAAKPVDERGAYFMKGWHQEKGDVFYHLAGVEEVIPLARMVEIFGPCIVPIRPIGRGVQQYQTPDPVEEPELWNRHMAKMGTKFERQIALLASVGYDLSFLKGGVVDNRHR